MIIHGQSELIGPSSDQEQAGKIEQGIGKQRLALKFTEPLYDRGERIGVRGIGDGIMLRLQVCQSRQNLVADFVFIRKTPRKVLDCQA